MDEDPAASVRAVFEERMNDNLDWAGAFDAVAATLIRAFQVDESRGIPPASREGLQSALREVDRVFGVLGPE